jgi:predicted dinucleotide-binding enzyme
MISFIRTISLLLALLFLDPLFVEAHGDDSIDDNSITKRSISLLGMGGMGKAIANCFMKHGYHVHAWNRTPKKEEWEYPDRLIVHATAHEAIASSDVTFVVINSAPKLQTVRELLVDDTDILLEGKTIVNMVNHDPYSAKELDVMIRSKGASFVAALMFGVPETVCSPVSHLLVSTSSHQNDSDNDVVSSLHVLGQTHEFTGVNDVGLASVVYLCLVQSLYFGLAGYELSQLILQKYMASTANPSPRTSDFSEDISQNYQKLATTLLSSYIPAFLPIISNTINKQQWFKSYVPAAAVVDMFALHDEVFERLHLFEDNYHATYVKYLQKTIETARKNGENSDAIGVSAVVQHYSADDFQVKHQQLLMEATKNDKEL